MPGLLNEGLFVGILKAKNVWNPAADEPAASWEGGKNPG